MSKKKRLSKPDEEKINRLIKIKESFNHNIQGVKNFVDHVKPVVEEADRSDIDAVMKAIKDAYKLSGLPLPQKGDENTITDDQKKILFRNLRLPEAKSPNRGNLLWKSNFILLLCSFEYLFADIISFYYKSYPQCIIDKTIEVDLSELRNCSSIEEYYDIVISKKVESILYKGIDKQIESLEKDLKLDMERNLIDWDIIKEAILRRHLIVHNNSIINKRYICVVNSSKIPDSKIMKEGKRFVITANYFNRVYQELFLAGNIILQNAWRKWLAQYEQVANSDLVDFTYQGNLSKQYIVSEKFGKYGKRYNTFNNEYRILINVNYCIALKGQNKKEEFNKEVKQIDISNLSPIYVLAYYALLDDKANSVKLLRNAKRVDKLQWDHIIEWPLFDGLREDKDFMSKAQKIFKPKLKKVKVENVSTK